MTSVHFVDRLDNEQVHMISSSRASFPDRDVKFRLWRGAAEEELYIYQFLEFFLILWYFRFPHLASFPITNKTPKGALPYFYA